MSFLLTLTFVRVFSPAEFGIVSGFWTIWILLMSMSRAVFGEQLIAQAGDSGLRRGYMDFGYLWTTVGLIISVVFLALTDAMTVAVPVACIALFVLSDIVRYQVMSGWNMFRDRGSWLSPWDLIRLAFCGVGYSIASLHGSEALALLSCFASSSVWVVLSLLSTGAPAFRGAIEFVRQKKGFEGLIALQFLTGTGAAQLIPFMALQAFGLAQYGGIRLTQSLLSPITLLVSALQPGLIAAMAERRERSAARKFLFLATPISVILATLLSVAVVFVIEQGQRFLIPPEHSAVISELIVPTSVLLALVVVALPGGATVRVFRLGGASLVGQLVGVLMTAGFAALAMRADIVTFVWALAGGSAVTVATTYILVFAALRPRGRRVAYRY
ncbi:hypothetical protein [Sinomonas flava]|uniref:hypothetical protein n=1 Tax=Sinomonas flava TaxID=496857 RepID=UPI0039A712D0